MTDQWFTYSEAATALGMTTESVRQRARREHWRKQLGNDGKARILVPSDTDRVPTGDTPGDAIGEAPASRPVKRPDPDTVVTTLQVRIAEMEARGAELRADLERERGERLQERDRAERLVGEVADLARQLAIVTQEAGARERDLQVRINTTERELAEIRARPWWRRLVG
jgi:hypothetical protein